MLQQRARELRVSSIGILSQYPWGGRYESAGGRISSQGSSDGRVKDLVLIVLSLLRGDKHMKFRLQDLMVFYPSKPHFDPLLFLFPGHLQGQSIAGPNVTRSQ